MTSLSSKAISEYRFITTIETAQQDKKKRKSRYQITNELKKLYIFSQLITKLPVFPLCETRYTYRF